MTHNAGPCYCFYLRIYRNVSKNTICLISDADAACADFDHGTPLHICATHLGLDTAKVLLQNSANPRLKDDLGRIPAG